MKRAITNHLAGLGVVLALAAAWPAQAGEGHDHGDAPAAPSANGPQRQPDGSVFLPKPGVLPITATVTAGAEVDLLAGELDLHEAPHADEAVHEHS